MIIGRVFHFEAAHTLPQHDGKCKDLHGHGYKLEVFLEGLPTAKEGPEYGMIMDFKKFKDFIQKNILKYLDHKNLNEVEGLVYPTVELTALWIAKKINMELPARMDLIKVKLWETEECWAESAGGYSW